MTNTDLLEAQKGIENYFNRYGRVMDVVYKSGRPVDSITVDISDFDLLFLSSLTLREVLREFPETAKYIKKTYLADVLDDEPLRIDPNPTFVFED